MPKGPEQYTPPEAEGKISLHDLLTYQNPNLRKYHDLSFGSDANKSFRATKAHFGAEWTDLLERSETGDTYENDAVYLKEKLAGTLLVDLGGGDQTMRGIPGTPVETFARAMGANTYINVDRFLASETDIFTDVYPEEHRQTGKPYVIWVNADMLEFIAHMPDNSASFSINGIDEMIIKNPAYHAAVAREIIRATRHGGIIFGINSDALYQIAQLNDSRIRNVPLKIVQHRSQYGVMVFEKISE